MTITCLYSCPLCDLKDVSVDVCTRDPGQDVRTWMKRVCIPTIAADHRRRRPDCYPETLDNLKIPIGNADYVGGPSVQ